MDRMGQTVLEVPKKKVPKPGISTRLIVQINPMNSLFPAKKLKSSMARVAPTPYEGKMATTRLMEALVMMN